MVSGECAVAPSTPNPPARLTAATTSRQWLKASSGNSMPSMSQIGDFMGVFLPAAAFDAALFWVSFLVLAPTLAYPGWVAKRRPPGALRGRDAGLPRERAAECVERGLGSGVMFVARGAEQRGEA